MFHGKLWSLINTVCLFILLIITISINIIIYIITHNIMTHIYHIFKLIQSTKWQC